MTREVIVVPPELSLQRAWDIMQRRRIRHLPVSRGGELIGMLSDRDVLLHARPAADGQVIAPDAPVAIAMTATPVTCEPATRVADLVRVMTERKIDALAVVDGRTKLIGLVTSTDLMLLLLDGDPLRPLPFDFQLHEDPDLAQLLA